MAPRTARAKKDVKSEDLSSKMKLGKIEKKEALAIVDLENVKGAVNKVDDNDQSENVTVEDKNNREDEGTVIKSRSRKVQKKNKKPVEEQLSDQENQTSNDATDEGNSSPQMQENPEIKKKKNGRKPAKVEKLPDNPTIKEDKATETSLDENDLKTEDDKPVTVKGKRGHTKKKPDNKDDIKNVHTNEDAEIPATKGRGREVQKKEVIESTKEDEPMKVDAEVTTEKKLGNGRGKKGYKKNVIENSENVAMDVDPQIESVPQEGSKSKGRGKKIPKTENKPEEVTPDLQDVLEIENQSKKVEKLAPKGRAKKAKATTESMKATTQEVSENNEETNVSSKTKTETRNPRKKVAIEETKEVIGDSENTSSTVENVNNTESEKPKGKGRGKRPHKEKVLCIADTEKDANEEDSDINKEAEAASTADDSEDVPAPEESEPQPKQAAKGKRGAAKKTKSKEDSEAQDVQEPPSKKSKNEGKKPLMNKATTDYDTIDFSNSSKNSQGQPWNLKISSWNVDGIRAWLTKGGLDYIKLEKPDILCLQEVKCSQDKLPTDVVSIPGYHPYWLCSDKDGYAGVGIYTTKMAINVQYGLQDEELDAEGRIITAEYEQFYLICTYVPNAGRQLVTLPKRLKWNEVFHKFVKELDAKKPVIICGDMNVAHNEIDLSNPKTNKKNAGFTEEERAGMTTLLKDGFVDTFRHLYPDKAGAYTFWTYMMNCRAKNVGWRLDYLIVSERLLPTLCDSVIRSEVFGSDHCPISLFLHLTSVPKIPAE